jgi:hypothetical protein
MILVTSSSTFVRWTDDVHEAGSERMVDSRDSGRTNSELDQETISVINAFN